MGRIHQPLTYPIVIKQVLDSLVISCPDLDITLSVSIPEKLDKDFVYNVGRRIVDLWARTEEKLSNFDSAKMKPPTPSSIKGSVTLPRDHELTLPEAARQIGVSENTLRRMIKRGSIKSRFTDGGHRRISENEIREYLENLPSPSPAPQLDC